MNNNNMYKKYNDNFKVNDAVKLLEELLNSKRCKDVMHEIENIKLSNIR